MKKSQIMKLLQNKLVLAALLMVLVAGTALAGVVALRNGESGEQYEETDPGYAFQTEEDDLGQDQLLEQPGDDMGLGEQPEGLQDPDATGLLQLPDREKETKDSNGDRPVQSGKVDAITDSPQNAEDPSAAVGDNAAEADTLVDGENAVVYEPESDAEEVIAPGAALEFPADSTIQWPVFGNIILDYSMDTTTYFPTLEQYKCNPGILIQAEVGQPVEAAVRGQVTAIGVNEELGNFIMMDLGDDYSMVYGQLEGLTVSVGQIVEAGEVLGVVAQPTKYYVVEGPNVYLEMRYHQEPVDPLDYIR